MSYLAGNAKQTDEDGRITYKQTTVFIHTVFFVIGNFLCLFPIRNGLYRLRNIFQYKSVPIY